STGRAPSPTKRASRSPGTASSSRRGFRSARPAPRTCCASPTSATTTGQSEPPRSDIAAAVLLPDRLDRLVDALHVRIDGEGGAERVQRAVGLADLAENLSKPGQRPEMTRLQRQDTLEVR